MKRLGEIIFNKSGSEIVEASIAMPIVILAVILFLRIFAFYFEILITSIDVHERALAEMCSYNGKLMDVMVKSSSSDMSKGGLLRMNLNKRIDATVYLINEDFLVRSHEMVKE